MFESNAGSNSIGRFTHHQLIKWAEKFGSPLYLYDGDRIRFKVRKLKNAFRSRYPKVRMHYAFKANSNLSVIDLLRKEGAGAECISLGEMKIALRLGYKGEDILFTSSSKSPQELAFAVEIGATVNLDSLGDFENLSAVLKETPKKIKVSFRVNPDVDPKTHRHIATGHKFTKFGILLEGDEVIQAYRLVKEHPFMVPAGIHSHVGSQITHPEPMRGNAQLLVDTVKRIKKELDLDLGFIDVGGGLGIPYQVHQQEINLEEFAETITGLFKEQLGPIMALPELWMEPGRYFVGDAGLLISRVNSVKHTPHTNFINIDTGFNHQLRPILYEAYHEVVVLGRDSPPRLYDIAGNICETGDILAEDRMLPTPKTGDFIAILDSGAYGFSMASEYNSFLLPAEVMILGETAILIRERETFEDLLRNQILIDAGQQSEVIQ